MKKTTLLLFFSLLLLIAKAQQTKNFYDYVVNHNTVELNITNINLFEQRTHFIYTLYSDERFIVSTGTDNGVFAVSTSEKFENQDVKDLFNEFCIEEDLAFNSMSKDEVGKMFFEWKSSLPDEFINSLMMDIYSKDRQNNLCATADPFCTDNGMYMFPAGVNAGNGEQGPNYSCLGSTPNPAWYYMRIDNPGNMTIYMYSEPSEDIDFCCWGPFDDPAEPCPNGLTGNKVVSCSYSPNPTENCMIPESATTGEYYILIITNYSNRACNINFSKTAGTGTTDCSILPPMIDTNTPCVGDNLILEAQEIDGAIYSWTGPNGWSAGNQRTIIRENATLEMAGDYSCQITIGAQTSDNMTVTAFVLPTPETDFDADDVCLGFPTHFNSLESVSPATYIDSITSRIWDFGDGQTSTGINPTHTYTDAGDYTVTYTTSIELHDGNCPDTKTKTVHVYDIPVADAGEDQNIYYGTSATLTAATVSGASYAWTPVNMIDGNPNQQTVQTVPMTGVQTFHLTVTSAHGCVNEDDVTISVGEEMTATVSCDDNEICNDTETTVSVTVSGGSHNYSYNWTSIPESVIDHPTSASTTVHPQTTTVYTCTVSDDATTLSLSVTVVAHPVLTTDLGSATICEQMLPYELDLPDGSKVYLYEEHSQNNPWDTIVYTEFGCKNHVSFVLTLSDITSYTRNVETCNEDYIWIDDLTGTGEVYHFTETGSYTKIFETSPCWTEVTVNFTRQPEYTDPYSYQGGVFDAGESCEPYRWLYVDPITGRILGDGNTYSVNTDKDVEFSTIHGCDSIVHFSFTRHYEVTVGDSDAVAIDTCMDSNGVYIWGGRECRQGDLVTGDVWNSVSGYFNTIHGCDSIAKIRLRLFDRPHVDNQIDGIKKVEMGDGLLPSIYNYTVTGLSGSGVDSYYPPTYNWEIITYYETPNNINGECSWTLASSTTSNVAQVFIDNIPGNALLKCKINTLCGDITTSLFIYTEGYEEGESVDEIDYDKLVEVYPNPASNDIYICHANEIINSQLTIDIYNFSGQLIDTFKSDTRSNVTTYSTGNYSNGIYFIKISGNNFNVMRKIVVSK